MLISCIWPGCDRIAVLARGLCSRCYQRAKRRGTLSGFAATRKTSEIENKEWFWAQTSPARNGCVVWTGALTPKGYGRLRVSDMENVAHRESWAMANGPIPNGLWVLHRCDNPPCVNPAHLFLGTGADNAADKVSKGRQARGQDNPRTKVTPDDVREMRRLWKSGVRQSKLAVTYGLNRASVCLIVNRRNWKHVV